MVININVQHDGVLYIYGDGKKMKSFPALSRNKETIMERSAAPSSLEFPLPCATEKQR